MDTNIVLISITKEELQSIIAEAVKEQLSTFFAKKPKDERLRTRKEVAKLLNVSLPTLHTWTKDGVINAIRIGDSVRYRLEDIEDALENIQSIKHSRYNKNAKGDRYDTP